MERSEAGTASLFSETTAVQFDQLPEAAIRAYVDTGAQQFSSMKLHTLKDQLQTKALHDGSVHLAAQRSALARPAPTAFRGPLCSSSRG